ncbi:Alpha/Beta hydrolase protein [Mycena vulgaris]|nr:Alpha/Beta hydrolase protein [Mycena vulgaris]
MGLRLVDNTDDAAAMMWTAFQISLIFATESYGAHFGPIFITYFNAQNALIDNDAPGYGPLQDNAAISEMSDYFTKKNGVFWPLTIVFVVSLTLADGRLMPPRSSTSTDLAFPSIYYKAFLRHKAVSSAIGATSAYDASSDTVKAEFELTGEFGRTALPPLAALVDAKFPILILVGDADIKANWLGVHDAMVAMSWYGNLTIKNTALTNWTINGTPVASIKTVDSSTFSRVYGGGHSLPA